MRTTRLTGFLAFATVVVTGLTVADRLLVSAQVQYHLSTYDSADSTKSRSTKKEVIKHKVAYKDSLETIASKYNVPWQRIYSKNATMQWPNDLKPGQEIIIPQPHESLAERPYPSPQITPPPAATNHNPAAEAPTAAKPDVVAIRPPTPGNAYAPGNCTWYAKSKRPDLPNNLGNANTWAVRAKAQGIATGSTPKVGAIGQRGMHVVYIEQINSDGTVSFSEMNYRRLHAITRRTLPANYFTYIY